MYFFQIQSSFLPCLFFPRLKIGKFSINTYWIICSAAALLLLITRQISVNEAMDGLLSNSSVNPIKIVVLFISMTLLSIFLDEIGFFKYLATYCAKRAKTTQFSLFIILYIIISVLTIFTSNDIVILTFTPFICYFAKNTKINPIPFLVAEFCAANTWSMMLVIGNPTNIYLAGSFGITFIEYLKVMLLPTILAGITEIIIICLLFKKTLQLPLEINIEASKISNIKGLIIGLIHLLGCLIMLVISSYLNLEMWLICLIFAISLVICVTIINIIEKNNFNNLVNTFKRLPYDLVPFVLSMFIIVLTLNKQGITQYLTDFLGEKDITIRYGISSFLACNLINNIPMSVLFSNIINIENEALRNQAIYSTIIGSNLGAFLTPIGALAGIMFVDLVKKQDVKFSFVMFLKYGSLIMIPTLFVALGMLSVWFY